MPDTLIDPSQSDGAEARSAPVLRMESVGLTLGGPANQVEILKAVNFEVFPGERVAIVGPSGSGKSSLLAVAAGLELPSSGKITLLGTPLAGLNEDALARLRRGRVSLVFQSFHLLPTMTALDNVRVPLDVARLSNTESRARQALEDVGLGHRIDHYPGQLSGGERQRVAVARALASDPEIVFADEPTGNLDTQTGSGVADQLFDIASDRGASLVLVTHDLALAKRADRQVEMKAGRLE
ncbi:MAG: ABC transporter ATP-binding protein [Pseudomonadota bacterium]